MQAIRFRRVSISLHRNSSPQTTSTEWTGLPLIRFHANANDMIRGQLQASSYTPAAVWAPVVALNMTKADQVDKRTKGKTQVAVLQMRSHRSKAHAFGKEWTGCIYVTILYKTKMHFKIVLCFFLK